MTNQVIGTYLKNLMDIKAKLNNLINNKKYTIKQETQCQKKLEIQFLKFQKYSKIFEEIFLLN